MSKIYVCHTLYHVFITMLKRFTSSDHCGIALVSTIPNVDSLAFRLQREGLFDRVCTIHRDKVFLDVRSYHANHLYAHLHRERIGSDLGYLREYDDICVFNDYSEVGAWLNLEQIPYHLLEDGLDCFAVANQFAPHGKARLAKRALHSLFAVPLGLAQGRMVQSVEVNDAGNLTTSFACDVIECPRRELMKIPSVEQIKVLFRVFEASHLLSVKKGSVLVLTGPLWENGITASEVENVCLHARMAAAFPGRKCYVKPHPRDNGDYSVWFSTESIISRNIPIELLNYLGENRFEVAITYSSTAIYLLSACRRRIVCDPDNTRDDVEHLSLTDKTANNAYCTLRDDAAT